MTPYSHSAGESAGESACPTGRRKSVLHEKPPNGGVLTMEVALQNLTGDDVREGLTAVVRLNFFGQQAGLFKEIEAIEGELIS